MKEESRATNQRSNLRTFIFLFLQFYFSLTQWSPSKSSFVIAHLFHIDCNRLCNMRHLLCAIFQILLKVNSSNHPKICYQGSQIRHPPLSFLSITMYMQMIKLMFSCIHTGYYHTYCVRHNPLHTSVDLLYA